jgi:hypothetical protein
MSYPAEFLTMCKQAQVPMCKQAQVPMCKQAQVPSGAEPLFRARPLVALLHRKGH